MKSNRRDFMRRLAAIPAIVGAAAVIPESPAASDFPSIPDTTYRYKDLGCWTYCIGRLEDDFYIPPGMYVVDGGGGRIVCNAADRFATVGELWAEEMKWRVRS